MKTVFEVLSVNPLDTWEEFCDKILGANKEDQVVPAAIAEVTGVYNGKEKNLLSLIKTPEYLNATLQYLSEGEVARTLAALNNAGTLALLVNRVDHLFSVLDGLDESKSLVAVNGLRRLALFDQLAALQVGAEGSLTRTNALKESIFRAFQGRTPRRQAVEALTTGLTPSYSLNGVTVGLSALFPSVQTLYGESKQVKQVNDLLQKGIILNQIASNIVSLTNISSFDALAFTYALGDFDKEGVKRFLDAFLLALSSKHMISKPSILNHYAHQGPEIVDFYRVQVAQVNLKILLIYFILFTTVSNLFLSKNLTSALAWAMFCRLSYFLIFAGMPPVKCLPASNHLSQREQLDRFVSILSCMPEEYVSLINQSIKLGIDDVTLSSYVKNELKKYAYRLHPASDDTILSEITDFNELAESVYRNKALEKKAELQLKKRMRDLNVISTALDTEVKRMGRDPSHAAKIIKLEKIKSFICEDKDAWIWKNDKHLNLLLGVIRAIFDEQTSSFGLLMEKLGVVHLFKPTKSSQNLSLVLASSGLGPMCSDEISKHVESLASAENALIWLGLDPNLDERKDKKTRMLENLSLFMQEKVKSNYIPIKQELFSKLLSFMSDQRVSEHLMDEHQDLHGLCLFIAVVSLIESSPLASGLDFFPMADGARDALGWRSTSYKEFSSLLDQCHYGFTVPSAVQRNVLLEKLKGVNVDEFIQFLGSCEPSDLIDSCRIGLS